MINKAFFLVKKFILGVLFIYGFNVMIFPLNITIPMSLFNIIIVTIFGIPGVIGLCLFLIFMF